MPQAARTPLDERGPSPTPAAIRPFACESTPLPPLPVRPTDGHKGTFGRVLIVAGSRGMSGAAVLAGTAALRGGAGLVTVATPHSAALPVTIGEPSYLTCSLPEDADGQLALAASAVLTPRWAACDAAAIGPGLGRSDELTQLVIDTYLHAPCPLVVDADALNALASTPAQWMPQRPVATRIWTPHPGEFARLMPTFSRETDRVSAAQAAARQFGVILLLKGAGTIITDGHRVALNPTGNAGMATGGSGDVLTGLLAALLASGLEPFAAAQWAAYLHGLAGDLAAEQLSQPGLIASDLPIFLAKAWRHIAR